MRGASKIKRIDCLSRDLFAEAGSHQLRASASELVSASVALRAEQDDRDNPPCSAAGSVLALACRKIGRCQPTPSFTASSASPITGISNGCVRR